MLQPWIVILGSFGYIGLLFAIAYFADRRARAGRSIINTPVIYSLSLAVYATALTFYGSVGRAAHDGVGFLPIYICLLYTSPSPRDRQKSRMPSSA